MSVNITVHGNPSNICKERNIFADLDTVKKAELDCRRKLRLQQVREQSKEIAAKVRNKYSMAKEKQLECIEKIKSDELKAWKRRNIEKLQDNYRKCIDNIGEAHKAAEDAEKCDIWFEEKKAMEQAAAHKRGREAKEKVRKDKEEKEGRKTRKKVGVSKPSKSIGVQVSAPTQAEKENHVFPISSSSSGSLPIKVPLNIDFSSDEDEYLDKGNIIHYNPNFYTSQSQLNTVDKDNQQQKQPFTQVSDFIKRRRESQSQSTATKSPSKTKNKTKMIKPPKQIILKSNLNVKGSLSSEEPAQIPSKVQYYDLDNKFSKEYIMPEARVERNMEKGVNAMEAAENCSDNDVKIERNRGQKIERSKDAFEKLQIRKDYEKMIEQCSNLAKTENQVKGLGVPSKPILTESKIKKMQDERSKKMNEAIENLINKRVLITCPPVREKEAENDLNARSSILNVAGINRRIVEETVISSDSCSSILIGYEKPEDPVKLPNQNQKIDEVKKLKELLQKISEQKEILEDKKKQIPEKEDFETRMKEKEFEMQQNEIEMGKKMLELRENHLKVQEQLLHDQLKKMRENKNVEIHETSSEENTLEEEGPVKIIIKVNNNKARKSIVKKVLKNNFPVIKKKRKSGSVKYVDQLSKKPGKVYPKTPYKQKKEEKEEDKKEEIVEKKQIVEESPISSTASTIYRNFPSKIENTMTSYLKEAEKEAPAPATAPIRSKASVPAPVPVTIPAHPHVLRQNEKTPEINPNLMQYIVRLLGMSRQSIDQLGVSSSISTVQTPSDSVVNVSDNIEVLNMDESRIAKLKQFIDENYNFLNEVNESLAESRLNGTVDENVDKVEDIWMKTLSKKEKEVRKMKQESKKKVRKHSAPTNHSPEKQRKSTNVENKRRTVESEQKQNSKTVPDPMVEVKKERKIVPALKQERKIIPEPIIEMKKQIKTVPDPIIIPKQETKTVPDPIIEPKQEPQNESLIEIKEASLRSILKSPKKASPKYAKIITPQGHIELINLSDRDEKEILDKYTELTEHCNKRISELSDMIMKVREEKKRLVENSISSSEPRNSTEYLDFPSKTKPISSNETSPRSNEEINNIFENQRQIGMSKDSGIAMSRPVTSSDFRDSPDFEPLLKDIPKVNVRVLQEVPPANKIKTKPPAAISRYSPHLEDGVAHELSMILEVETPLTSKINISTNESNMDHEKILIEARNKLLAQNKTIEPQKFPKYEEYVIENKLEDHEMSSQLKLNVKEFMEVSGLSGISEALQYQQFPTPNPEFNFTNETLKPQNNSGSSSQSQSSLPDVVAELKRRNIMQHSFRNSLDDSNRSTPLSVSPPPEERSPRKRNRSKKSSNVSGVEVIDQNSISEGTETLERDLNQLGLKWASTMLKKSHEVAQGSASSSSSLSIVEDLKMGKPLNIKEFVAREFMIRTNSDLNSLSDSSISSQFLKSLLNTSNVNITSPALLTQTTDRVQRTSTPVATKSSASTPKNVNGNSFNVTTGLFSGESRLSSVHSSSSDSNNDKLTIPNLKLDIEKYKSSSSSASSKQ